MSEDPLASPRKTQPDATAASDPAVRAAPAGKPVAPTERSATSEPDEADSDSKHRAAKGSPWLIILGVLSAVLLITVIIFANKVSARDRAMVENKNRTEQVQSAATKMQTEVDDAKAATTRVQKQLDDANAQSTQLTADLDKAKATIANLQARLEKASAQAGTFQTQGEEAKVASLKHQGEVEVARAQTAVMSEQLNQAKADTAELRTQLAAIQVKLDNANNELIRLQKPPARK